MVKATVRPQNSPNQSDRIFTASNSPHQSDRIFTASNSPNQSDRIFQTRKAKP
ncbi:hypothetical protein ACOKW7_08020 [Limnospira platensis CENA597]|uniref:hypothetical protein n=1 Tax=Limnospira platensis TaxID=118562 RepID=UPI003DA1C85B